MRRVVIRALPELVLALVVAVLLLRCIPVPPPIDPGPPEPEPPPAPVTDCGTAEARLLELQCRTATGDPLWVSPLGERFTARCERELSNGVEWRVDCLSKIESCDKVDAATRGEWCGP